MEGVPAEWELGGVTVVNRDGEESECCEVKRGKGREL